MRVTSKHFLKKVEILESLLEAELTTNIWHRHFSVYTAGPNGSCQTLLVSSDTARDACDQIDAIFNTLYFLDKKGKENSHGSI